MQPTKILVIGDVHICDHSPGQRVEGYKEHILAKLYECVKIAHSNNITHVLFLGDIFHVKVANRISHRLVQDMASLFNAFNLPIIILVGNHDITDGTLDTLEKQPLGTFEFLPNVTLLKNDKYSISDDINIYPVPGVTGITLEDFTLSKENKNDILAVHQSIVPDISKEKEMLQDHCFDAKAIAENTDIDIILYGHHHRFDGIYNIARDCGTSALFSNLGSICRLTVVDEDVNKEPSVLILSFDSEDNAVTEIVPLTQVVPASEAYFLDEHLEQKAHNKDIEDTIKKLRAAEITSFSIESVISDVEFRSDIDRPVKEAALQLLEEVK